jgi:integrase
MYKSEPDYVTGRRGRFDLYPWITHPPFCVCAICPKNREREAAKSGRPIGDVWAEPLDIRVRRDSPYPANRKQSAGAAIVLKKEEERTLAEAVAKADAERRARQNAVSFGAVAEAYRHYLISNGKEYDTAKSRIDNIEALIGPTRDTAAVNFDVYRELIAEVSRLSQETQRHYASMLLAMLNHAVAERIIASHQLQGVRVPQVPHGDEPEPWTQHELGVIIGPALVQYEREQAAWNAKVANEKANRGLRSPSLLPLRGLCLVGYYTLMRPKNNRALSWDEIVLDPLTRRGWFKLDQHKNVNKGIKARGGLAAPLVDYLLSIRPKNARGLIHPNPASGKAYVDIRKQWARLVEIASRMLGYELTGKKADFFNFRHTGASHIATRSRDGAHLLGVVRMMGDTSLATVNRHYFNLDDETLQVIVEGWQAPDVDLFGTPGAPLTH